MGEPPVLYLPTRIALLAAVLLITTVAAPVTQSGRPEIREQVVAIGASHLAASVVSDRVRSRGPVSVAFDIEAEMVGFTWTDRAELTLEVRAWIAGRWGEWLLLEANPAEGPDDGSGEGEGRGFAGPAWLGHDFTRVEVRLVGGEARSLELHAIDTENPTSTGGFAHLDAAGAAVQAPFVIPRSQWGADESWRTVNCDGRPQYASDVRFAVVHHTATANTYGPGDAAALIRGIYYFHVFGNGWCDIGYNFLVDRFGQVFEGRYGGIDQAVLGGHAGGFNSGSTGVAVLGDFTQTGVPAATYDALRQLLSWKLAKHGVDPLWSTTEVAGSSPTARWPAGTVVSLATIGGHRDTNVTSCPGQYLYDLLPALRADVAATIAAGLAGESVLMCDWNGDGVDTPGLYDKGTWYLRNSLSDGPPEAVINYGVAGFIPVCGDWNGDGADTIGVYVDGLWILRDSNSPGFGDYYLSYGAAGFTPVVGDWDGQRAGGRRADGIGVYVGGRWLLRNSITPGYPDVVVDYGTAGFHPVVGDWDGDGVDTIGVFVGGRWILRNSNTPGWGEYDFWYGSAEMQPLTGDWDGDGSDTQGVHLRFHWWLRNSLGAGWPELVFDWASGA